MHSEQEACSSNPYDRFIELAESYAKGDAKSGKLLVAAVDETNVPHLPHAVRAVLMDTIMANSTAVLDPHSSKLLRAALVATTDISYLTLRAQHYLSVGHQQAAETLLEWRVVLCAQCHKGTTAHIEAMIDLAAVYLTAGKIAESRDLRGAAITTCERAAEVHPDEAAGLLGRVSLACFDASDLEQAERAAKRSLSLLEAANAAPEELIKCLRVLHTLAQTEDNQRAAQNLAHRILRLQGATKAVDEIERAIATYIRLPEQFDLKLLPDGIDVSTSDFPGLIVECCGLDLKKYFKDAFAQSIFLTPAERARLAKDLFHAFKTVSSFSTGADGAKLVRTEALIIDLPHELTQGFVQQMTIGTTVGFRLVTNPPDGAAFADIEGITFNAGGKVIGVRQISLQADGQKCTITPQLDERGQVKQTFLNPLEALANSGKDFLVGMFLATQSLSTEVPIVLNDYRNYMAGAINFKSSLQYKEKDLLSFFERCSSIEIDDPFTRSLLQSGMRISKNGEEIRIDRQSWTECNLGGIALKMAPLLKLTLLKTQGQLDIPEVSGVDVRVPFDSPRDLTAIGLDLKRSLPQRLVSLKLSAKNTDGKRRLVTGIGPSLWIAVDVDDNMAPAFDELGNWLIVGVTSNPISGSPQSFFLRLDKHNNLNMTAREITALVDQTATEAFDPKDPKTWHWGAVAFGAKTVLTAGDLIRSKFGEESTDKIAEEAKKLGKFIGKLFS